LNHYEMVCILAPGEVGEDRPQPEEVVGNEIEKIGGKISSVHPMGRRRLAYPIGETADGVYLLVYFSADPAGLEPLRASMKLNSAVVRALILRAKAPVEVRIDEGAETRPSRPLRPLSRRDDEDESGSGDDEGDDDDDGRPPESDAE